jgi:hypothetical protein
MRKIAIIATVAFVASCSTIKSVDYDIDRSVNFRKYKTYAWIPSQDVPYKDQRYNNQIVENNIKSFSSASLTSKGLQLNVDTPDLLFYYDLQIEKGEHTMQVPIYAHPHNFAPPPPMMMPMHPGMNGQQMLMQQQMMQQQMMMQQQWMPGPQIIGYETRRIPFKNGTLTIVCIERKTNRMIWRGWSESSITDPRTYRENLERKISLIFNRFPNTTSR